MCDYSLTNVKSRPAKVGDRLVTTDFRTGTRGFSCPTERDVAVCVLPGTELAFDAEIRSSYLSAYQGEWQPQKTAIFRQISQHTKHAHHDCLELPDSRQVMLNHLYEGQTATVLQLPAKPKTEAEKQAQTRVEYV